MSLTKMTNRQEIVTITLRNFMISLAKFGLWEEDEKLVGSPFNPLAMADTRVVKLIWIHRKLGSI